MYRTLALAFGLTLGITDCSNVIYPETNSTKIFECKYQNKNIELYSKYDSVTGKTNYTVYGIPEEGIIQAMPISEKSNVLIIHCNDGFHRIYLNI